ncbi:MAG: glutathione peroxidase [Flavobacteriales bacterium]|nr:glutathione peroxidase [Flavobacteriales bacterium]
MKTLVVLFSALLLSSSTVYDISLNKISGESFKLSDFRGKKVLIVNTASKCGYTSQYGDLEKLYQEYKDKLEIVGMPCNQFMGQEPGKNSEISAFCKKNYGVTFTLLEKGYVKGSNQHPLYSWLTKKEKNGVDDYKITWNFNKFLLDEDGKLIGYFGSGVSPTSEKITSLIK